MKKNFTEKYPYVVVILLGLVCTFMTGFGVAISQITRASETNALWITAAAILLSAGVGLFIMTREHPLSEYGFCRIKEASNREVWWYLPLIMIEVLPLLFYGVQGELTVAQYPALLCFVVAVGFNEEIYFRGLALKILSIKGKKRAIVASSVIFGLFHFANALNGKSVIYLVLQILFAFLVGIVLAEIVCITNSLWIVILWHASHDFISSISGDSLDVKALILLALQVVILLIYAYMLWAKATREENVI